METKMNPEGQWTVVAETRNPGGRRPVVAILPSREAAEAVVSQWEIDQDAADASWIETLRANGMALHGSGMEVAVSAALVLALGGRLV